MITPPAVTRSDPPHRAVPPRAHVVTTDIVPDHDQWHATPVEVWLLDLVFGTAPAAEPAEVRPS